MKSKISITLVFRILLIIVLLTCACNLFDHLPGVATEPEKPAVKTTQPGEQKTPAIEGTVPPASTSSSPIAQSQGPRFAVFEESPGEVSAFVQQEKIAADISNVRNTFLLSKGQIERLGKDGFVVNPGTEIEFFSLYEKARYDNVPVFVTSDSLLHSYHLLFDKVLRTAEVEHFLPLLKVLNQSMLAKTDEIYQQLQGSAWQEAAKRLVAYYGVGSLLLDRTVQVPAYANDLVQAELALIDQAKGIFPSPIFPGLDYGEDYTQYIPRGHYTKSEDLKAYFKSMMWYGRMTFRLKGQVQETGREETRSAILLVYALQNSQVNNQPAIQAWSDLYSPTVFFVGRSDDLTVIQYGDVSDYVYGKPTNVQQLTDEKKLDQFIEFADQLPPPKILGIVISDQDDETKATKGLRFMGQRFVPDAYIFRQLIYRNVGTSDHRRGLPRGLDLMAAMGSQRAYQHLEELGDTGYENYPQQMEKVKTWLTGLTVPEWTETLNNTWLYSFFPLLEAPGDGYPEFMRSQAWLDKQLNATLGSWAELKHDTILYAKQVYAEMGGGPPPPPPLPPRGYVEPVPKFYNRLAALTAMTRTGLDSRTLLSDADRDGLGKLEDLARACQVMAEKELRGEALSDAEYERIRFFGGELEKLVILSADMDTKEESVGNPISMAEDQQAAVIADVATDPDPSGNGSAAPIVLEEGVGRVNEIYAVVPVVDIDGKTILQVVKGGSFSYYEFHWPADDRLTDEKWRQMLDEKKAPALPDWAGNFMVAEGAYSDLAKAVYTFEENVTYLYWDPIYSISGLAPEQEGFRSEIESLNQAKQYIGHQLNNINFRSFDLQSSTRAVVTVRETWKDQLFSYPGANPNYDEKAISERGPYSLDVTYVLEYVTDTNNPYWKVAQAQYANRASLMVVSVQTSPGEDSPRQVRLFRKLFLVSSILILGMCVIELRFLSLPISHIASTEPYWLYRRNGFSPSADDSAASLLIVGDVMLGRGVARVDDPFRHLDQVLTTADYTIGNYEGVISGGELDVDKPADEAGNIPYRLVAPVGAPARLQAAGFDLLGLANNHCLDLGEKGLDETVQRLATAGINIVGTERSIENSYRPSIIEVKGIKIAFLAINAIAEPKSSSGGGSKPRCSPWNRVQVVSAIRQLVPRTDLIMVLVHWGDEYEQRAGLNQRRAALEMVEAGADVVIGSHPHVVQETQVIEKSSEGRDGFIAYSLGNFIFDQFEEDTQVGLALRLLVDRAGLESAEAIPVHAGVKPNLLDSAAAQNLLERIRPLADRISFECNITNCSQLPSVARLAKGIFSSGQIDLKGNGTIQTIRLENGRVGIYVGSRLEWESPAEWQVLDAALGDPNNDGRGEIVLVLRKPDGRGGFSSHPFVIGYRGGIYRQLWGGSAVAIPIREVDLTDLDGDGQQELIVLEEREGGMRTIAVWRWNDWVFKLIWRSAPGNFVDLQTVRTSDGRSLISVGQTW